MYTGTLLDESVIAAFQSIKVKVVRDTEAITFAIGLALDQSEQLTISIKSC